MAGPSIVGVTGGSGLSRTSPAGTQVGDLIVCVQFERNTTAAATHTLDGNYTSMANHLHDDGSTDGRFSAGRRVAAQAGAQTYQSHTSSVGTDVGGFLIAIRNWDINSLIVIAPVTSTGTTPPNPPNITGMTAAREYIAFAIGAWHLSAAADVAITPPTNYNEQFEISGSSIVEISVASRVRTGVTSEDPGAFADSVTPNGTVAWSFAIASPALGTLSKTLANATLSADADVRVKGSLSKTLANATLSADADARVKGSLSKTLANATLAADADVRAKGALAKTLGNATLSATGEVTGLAGVAAIVDVTLANSTLAADADVRAKGALAKTLAPATLAATGAARVSGSLSKTLANATVSADADVRAKGALAKTLAPATLAATGAARVSAALTKTLANATLAATGKAAAKGALAKTLADATLNATASTLGAVSAELAATLQDATLAATSHIGPTQSCRFSDTCPMRMRGMLPGWRRRYHGG